MALVVWLHVRALRPTQDEHDVMTNQSERPSCFIIGLGSLPIRCAEYLLDNDLMEIRGIISADESLIAFGKSRGLDTLQVKNKVNYSASKSEIDAFLGKSSFDYLFSIINAMFLPEAIIQLPGKMAINFHDSELPKYAGIDATSWAIMRREPRHAVTWHLMVRGIDEGDIVKQVYVPIEERETAFTLNEKCLDAGFASFKELVADIQGDAIDYRRQSPEKRSYYSRSKPYLPEMSIWNHGVVSWQQSAEEIEALTRALDYGPSRNALGTAKMFIGRDFYILPSVAICEAESELEPGTVVRTGADGMVVSTSSRDVLVNCVLTITGRPTSIGDLAARHHIASGTKLDEVPPDLVRRIKELDKDIMWKEAYWANAIKGYVATPGLQIAGELLEPADSTSATARVCLRESTRDRLEELIENNDLDLNTLLLAFFSSFLTRSGGNVVSFWYSDEEYRGDVTGMTKLVSPFALCRMTVDDACGIVEHCAQTAKQLSDVKKMRHFLFDITSRYPQLRGGRSFDELQQCAFVSHGVSGQQGEWSMSKDAFDLSLEVVGDAADFSIAINVARGGFESARRLAEQFSAHVGAVVSSPETSFVGTSSFVA